MTKAKNAPKHLFSISTSDLLRKKAIKKSLRIKLQITLLPPLCTFLFKEESKNILLPSSFLPPPSQRKEEKRKLLSLLLLSLAMFALEEWKPHRAYKGMEQIGKEKEREEEEHTPSSKG